SGYMQMRCRRTPTRSPRRSPGRAPCSSPDTCCSCTWKRTGDIFRRESSRPRTPDRKRKQQSTDAGLAWNLAQNTFRRHDARSCLTVPTVLTSNSRSTQIGESPVAKKRAKRRGWTSKDVRELKSMARARTPARDIGRKLGRTEGAVRQKAYAEGVAFNSRTRARRKRK